MSSHNFLEQQIEKLRSLLDEADLSDAAVIELLLRGKIPVIQPLITNQTLEERLQTIERKIDILSESTSMARCRLGEEEKQAFKLVVADFASAERAKTHLRDSLLGCDDLIICDPYIYQGEGNKDDPNDNAYCKALLSILPDTLSKMAIYYSPKKTKKHIVEKIDQYAKSEDIQLAKYATPDIHDRVWIKNQSRGWVVGTSFNGLGKKLAFLLELPREDLDAYLFELKRVRKSCANRNNR